MNIILQRRLMYGGGRSNVPTEDGVYIKYVGNYYSAYDSLDSEKTPVGVGIVSGSHSLLLHPDSINNVYWAADTSSVISGITTVSFGPVSDFEGKSNTDVMMSQKYSIRGAASAFAAARSAVYANGQKGWLPAGGEMQMIYENLNNVNVALSLIGGTQIVTSSGNDHWCSTQRNGKNAFYYDTYYPLWWTNTAKNYKCKARSVSEL